MFFVKNPIDPDSMIDAVCTPRGFEVVINQQKHALHSDWNQLGNGKQKKLCKQQIFIRKIKFIIVKIMFFDSNSKIGASKVENYIESHHCVM